MAGETVPGLAIGAPYFKVIGMARGPMAAAMVGKTIGKAVESKEVPVYISRFGRTIEDHIRHIG